MPSYTSSLRLIQPTTGEYPGTWGTQVNTGLTALVDNAVAGTATIAVGSTDYTLSTVNGAADEARSAVLNLTAGAGVGARNIICPAVSKLYVVVNNSGFTQTIKTAAGTGVAVPTGKTMQVRCDGTNVVDAVTYISSDNVNFLQSGTGAVNRTVQSKLRDSVSVKDFGATGNGVADDLTAINLAVASGAKAVYFPAGTYRTSGLINVAVSGVMLWTDAQAVIKPLDGVAVGFSIIQIRGSNVTLDGFIIDGNTAAPPVSGNNNGISLDTNSGTLTNVDILNCTLQNFKGYGIPAFAAGTLTNVNIFNCTFVDFTSTAATPPAAIQLVQPTCSDIRVTNSYFKNLTGTGFAVRSVNGSAAVTNVAVTGCVFEHNTSAYTTIGMEVLVANNLSVSGCTFKNARMGISCNGQNIAIAGNSFDNETSYCIEAGTSIGLSVSGNSFSNFQYGLIHYNGARDVTIDGNTFRDALSGSTSALNLGWGVQQSAAGGAVNYEQFVISNNVFKNCSGVRLHEPNANIVEGNVFETTSANNICKLQAIENASTRCVFANNVFRTSVNVGTFTGLLVFAGGDHAISNNTFISTTGAVNNGAGLAVSPGVDINNIVISNTYANNFTFGIYLGAAAVASNVSAAGTETVNCATSVLGMAGVENFYGFAKAGRSSVGDVDYTLDALTGKVLTIGGAGITANRTITLDSTDVTVGTEYTIVRTGAGEAFTIAVGSLVNLNRNEACTIVWDGASWKLTGYFPQSFRTIYQNSRSANYTAVLSDSGKQVFHPASDNNPRTFTIPANSSVGFPIGTELMFINMINTVTIAITSDTLTQAGTGATGSRTLAANGWARAVKITSTQWLIDGTGLT